MKETSLIGPRAPGKRNTPVANPPFARHLVLEKIGKWPFSFWTANKTGEVD